MEIEIVPSDASVQHTFSEPILVIQIIPEPIVPMPLRFTREFKVEYETTPNLVSVTYLKFPITLEQVLNLPDCERKFFIAAILASEKRHFVEAREFARKSAFSHQLYLIVAHNADYNSKTRDAVSLILELVGVDDVDSLIRCYPDDNAFFDVESVIGRYSERFAEKLIDMQRTMIDCEYEVHFSAATLYFADILVETDIRTLSVDVGLLQLLQTYSMNKRYNNAESLEHLLKVICRTVASEVPLYTVQFQLDLLLDLTRFGEVDHGFAFNFYQVLLCNIAQSQDLENGMDIPLQLSERLITRLETKFVEHYIKIVGNAGLFQACINLSRAMAMTYNYTIAEHDSTLGFLSELETLFWSENEVQEVTVKEFGEEVENIQEAVHFNCYFLEDVHIALELMSEFMTLLNARTAERVEGEIANLVRTFFHNVVVVGFRLINSQQELSQGTTYSQIFIVSNEIIMFAAKFSTSLLREMLIFYFDAVVQFVTDYSLNEILLHQLFVAIDMAFFIICDEKGPITVRLRLLEVMIQFYKNASKWVTTELYSEYFKLMSDIMYYFTSCVEVIQMMDDNQKEHVKTYVGQFCCNVLRFGVEMNQFLCCYAHYACKLGLFQFFHDTFAKNVTEFDPQYVCEFCCQYLLSQIEAEDIDNFQCLELSLEILSEYAKISFSQQSYVELGRLTAGILIFALESQTDNVFQRVFTQIMEEILSQRPQSQFFMALANALVPNDYNDAEKQEIDGVLKIVLQYCPVKAIVEIRNQHNKCLNEDNSESTQDDTALDISSRDSLFVPSAHSIINYPDRISLSFLDFKQFPEFPQYSQVEELKKFVDFPGIPFTFVIPHYLAKMPESLTDVDALVDDIGQLDAFSEEVEAKLTFPERPKSGKCYIVEPDANEIAQRPCSAGHSQKADQSHASPVSSPKRRPEVATAQLENWSGSDGDEEDLLQEFDQKGDFE